MCKGVRLVRWGAIAVILGALSLAVTLAVLIASENIAVAKLHRIAFGHDQSTITNVKIAVPGRADFVLDREKDIQVISRFLHGIMVRPQVEEDTSDPPGVVEIAVCQITFADGWRSSFYLYFHHKDCTVGVDLPPSNGSDESVYRLVDGTQELWELVLGPCDKLNSRPACAGG